MEKTYTINDETYTVEDFEESKLCFKKNCKEYEIITKTGLTKPYKKNIKIELGVDDNAYITKYVRDINWSLTLFYFGSKSRSVNCFIDKLDNYCLLYDFNDDFIIEKEISVLQWIMDILEVEVPIEIYKLKKGMRKPIFLTESFKQHYGFCIRIPAKDKIISASKSANKR